MTTMDLAYEERGSGPVLVLVHGFPLNSTMWIEQLKGLAKVRRVVAVDLRGHGYTEVDDFEGFSMDQFADDIAMTLTDIGVEQVDLCGLSMGGYVVMAFWRRHPDKVRSLIFCDTKPEADSDEAKAGREKTAAMVREQGMEPLIEGLLPKMLGTTPSDEAKSATERIMLACHPQTAAAAALAMRDRADSTGDMAGINVPVLWMHGEQDQLMPLDGGRASAATIPNCTFVAIPNAGHVAPLENPEAVNAAMTEFLKTVDPPKK